MKKVINGFNTPTISSVNKSSSDPAFLRDKIQRLSNAVTELRHNVIQEDTYLENIQHSNLKNYNELNFQMQTLKKSFNQLSDILLSEITSLNERVGMAVNQINLRVDGFGQNMNQCTQITEQISMNQQELEQEIQHLSKLNTAHNLEIDAIHNITSRLNQQVNVDRDENKQLNEKLKLFMSNYQNQIDLIQKDKVSTSLQLLDLKTKQQQFVSGSEKFEKRLQDLEDQFKIQVLELQTKLNELKGKNYTSKQQQRSEQAQVIGELSKIVSNIEDRMRSYDDNIEQTSKFQRYKLNEFETQITQKYQHFQQDLQDLATIYKDSSTQILLDFEKTVKNNHNEIKYVLKKIEQMENKLIEKQKRF